MFRFLGSPQSPLKGLALRQPGEALDEDITNRALEMASLFMSVVFCCIFSVSLFFIQHYQARIPEFILIALPAGMLLWFATQFLRVKNSTRNKRLGRDGEREVAFILNQLTAEGFSVLNDVYPENGYGNTDHVVIGPSGIYAIETKTRSFPSGIAPSLWYDATCIHFSSKAYDTKAIHQSKRNAKTIHDVIQEQTRLDLFVFPVVLYPGWTVEHRPSTASFKFRVFAPEFFLGFARASKVRLTKDEIRSITLALATAPRKK